MPSAVAFDIPAGLPACLTLQTTTAAKAGADFQAEPLCCLALALEPSQAPEGLRLLARFPLAAPAQLHSHAGISRLYPDGRIRHIAVAQIECVLRQALLPKVLGSLEAAGLLSALPDRRPIVGPVAGDTACECQIFCATPEADYAQFVRWRRLPSAFAPRAAAERRAIIRFRTPAPGAVLGVLAG